MKQGKPWMRTGCSTNAASHPSNHASHWRIKVVKVVAYSQNVLLIDGLETRVRENVQDSRMIIYATEAGSPVIQRLLHFLLIHPC